MQKLTPSLGHPPALMKVCHTSALGAFVLVANIAIMTMKKNKLIEVISGARAISRTVPVLTHAESRPRFPIGEGTFS